MTPPGLTCTRCALPLTPSLARRTPKGYQHAHKCRRRCGVEGCERPHDARGYCRTHYGHAILGKQPSRQLDPDARLEDIEWMAQTGESLHGAAQRLGITTSGVERFLRRVDRPDLIAVLSQRNPRDHHAGSNLALLGDWG